MIDLIFSFITYLDTMIQDNYFFSFCVYFFISICFFTLSLPGGILLLLSSGFFFGFFQGFLINIFSISLGSFLFIYLSKSIFRKIFNKYYYKYSSQITNYIKSSSFEYLILMRLIIGPPLALQNICIAMLNISKFKVFFSTIIGFTPLMLLFSYLGNYTSSLIELKSITLIQIFSFEIFLLFGIIIIFIMFRIYFKK